ncbi:MAG: globin [Betaproteobacteria bacterium RIFCSPLOWO2_02_67_12]|nr:MAG: globin [Betaproteobacteria bacterium RIFCSPLOWO2_02_67_12]
MTQSLYERMGGAKGILSLVDDIIALHRKNPVVGVRFEKTDLKRLREKAIEFFTMGTGGPATYTGKDMREAHRGMNISEQEFVAVLDDILAAMDKNQLDDQAKREVLAIAYSLKGEVIRV